VIKTIVDLEYLHLLQNVFEMAQDFVTAYNEGYWVCLAPDKFPREHEIDSLDDALLAVKDFVDKQQI
jgi:hypothetical protein